MQDQSQGEIPRSVEKLKKRIKELEQLLQSEEQRQIESLKYSEILTKQLELMKKTHLDIPSFLDQTLDQVLYSTASKFGFIYLYDEEKQEFRAHSFSKTVMKECRIKQRNELYELSQVGLWAETVRQRNEIIVNDYQALHPLKKGYPSDHITIHNFVSIPVFSNGQLVAVAGAANKDCDYDDKDLFKLHLLMNTIWPMVELRQQQEKIREDEERYRLLYEESNKQKELLSTTISSVAEGIFVTDAKGKIMLLNPTAENITGLPREAVLGRMLEGLFRPGDELSVTYSDLTRRILKTGKRVDVEKPIRLIRKDDSDIYVTGTFAPLITEGQEVSGIVITIKDTSKEYLLEKEIEGFLNVNLDLLCVGNLDGKLIKVNKKFEQVLGYKTAELEGKNFMSFVHPDDIEATFNAFSVLGAKQPLPSFINRYRCKDGSYKYIEWNSLPGLGELLYASARDVTEKITYEEKLKVMATKDELTGLYNRHYFDNIVPEVMVRSERFNEPLSFLLFDLDYFKEVNDTYGHQMGDEVLQMTARITERALRDTDIFFRIGGDEFLVLMPQTPLAGAAIAAEKLRAAFENQSFPVIGRQTISIGVAEKLKSEEFEAWLGRVDAALYQAKQQGRNLVAIAEDSR